MPVPLFYNDLFTPIAGEGTAPYSILLHLADSGQGYALGPSYGGTTPPVINSAGRARTGSTTGTPIVAVSTTDAHVFTDGVLTFNLYAGTDTATYSGITFRHSNNGSTDTYYTVYRQNNTLQLAKVVNGVGFTLVGGSTPGWTAGTTYTIRVVVSGQNLQVFRNGQKLIDVTDASITGGGKVGLMFVGAASALSDTQASQIDSFQAYDQPAANVGATDAGIYFNLLSWYTSGTAYRQTNNAGAYLKFVTDSGYVAVNIDTSMYSAAPGGGTVVRYQIDDGAWQEQSISPGQTSIQIVDGAAGTSHLYRVWCRSLTGALDCWNTPVSVFRVTGLTLDSGKTPVLPTVKTLKILELGDSITRAYYAGGSSSQDDTNLGYAAQLAEGLDAEYAQIGWSGQGWAFGGNGSSNVPNARASWKLYSAGKARDFTVQPDVVTAMWGTNDQIRTPITADATVTSEATAWLADARATCPNAIIVLIVPPSGAKKAALLAATLPDARSFIIDPSVKLAQAHPLSGATADCPFDGVHPGAFGHGRLAAYLLQLILSILSPAVGDVRSGTKYALGKVGTLAASTGYPLLPANVVLFGYPRGDGTNGDLGIPLEDAVLEGTQYGSASVSPKVGRYRPPNRLWYLQDGPGYGPTGSLILGDAIAPDTVAVLTGYSVKKNGVNSPGRYVPPAQGFYLSTGPSYALDGLTLGTASQNVTIGGGGGRGSIGL